MIGHEDISMNHNAVALVYSLKTTNKAKKIPLYPKNRPLLVPPCRNVIKTTFPLDSQRSGHNATTSTINQCLMSRPDTVFLSQGVEARIDGICGATDIRPNIGTNYSLLAPLNALDGEPVRLAKGLESI